MTADQMHHVAEQAHRFLTDYVDRRTAAWSPGNATVTRTFAREALHQPVSRTIVRQLGRAPSSVMSRLYRAGLPTPKEQLSAFRLVIALKLSRSALNSSAIALTMDYSSPQAFARHIRFRFGLSPIPFFTRWTPERFITEALDPLMVWDDERWIDSDSLDGRPSLPYFRRTGVPVVAETLPRPRLMTCRVRTLCPACGRLLVKSE